MSLKKKEISVEKLKANMINFDVNSELNFKNYSHLISDWSGIFVEYSIINKQYSILINTKQKIRNIKSDKFPEIPLEIFSRDKLGYTLEIENLNDIKNLLDKSNADKENKITKFYDEYFFN